MDQPNDRYYNIINSTYNSPSGSIPYQTQDYLINKVLYREIAAMNYSQWGKANATASDYHLFNDFAYQVFLQNYSTITALPDESVGTAPCYVLKATVDIRRYYIATIGSHWADPQLRNSTLNSDINTTKEWTVTYWIAKADYQLQQMNQRTILEYLTPTHSRSTEDTTTRFRDHNAPVTIELPPEAIAANWTIFG